MSFFQEKLREPPLKLSENQELLLERIKSREERVQEAKNTLSSAFKSFQKEKNKEITEISGPFKVNEIDHYILVAFKRKFLGRKGKLTCITVIKNDGEILKEEESAKKILFTSLFQALIQSIPAHMIIRDELRKGSLFIEKFSSLLENGSLLVETRENVINITISPELLEPEKEEKQPKSKSYENLLSSIVEYSEIIEKLSNLEIDIISDPSFESIIEWLELTEEQFSTAENLTKVRTDYISISKKFIEKISNSEHISLINKIFEQSISFLNKIENMSEDLTKIITQTNDVLESILIPLWQT